MFLGLGPSAFAASGKHDTDNTLRLENATFPWHFPPPVGLAHPASGGTCEAIPQGIFINPIDNRTDRVRKVTREVLADGSQVISQDDLKTGTAEDSDGKTYHFVYKNRSVVSVSFGLPATAHVTMTDSFRLTGNGLHMHASFDWSWDSPAPDGVDFTLDPFADGPSIPFVFATADGVNPAPGVTNWQQLSTQGDPFHCDPL